ncbi:DNA-binding protein [Scytonema hofmannii PCC 7110]|uniref:DNA-binding protein n=1 Tax=Scytonema hofmannii PCC 7110 TaxID=128403 RepID=A0A139XFT9_9CYAN|nr:DNA-binding protein [Scytonema hofmannii]KYC43556.1 DNA-binding protein [Scytonema hofmannii PCC 7110]
MREYEFTLKFRLPDPTIDTGMYVDALYESGCDDAIIGTGIKGLIALDFIREAPSAYDAMSSAIKDVRKAIPQAEVVEASPDFVGVTDVANLLGCSRQNVQKLLSNSISNRPPAVYGGAQSVWHLFELLIWLIEHKSYHVDESLVEVAKITRSLNLVKQSEMLDPEIQKKIQDLFSNNINT